MKKSTAYLFLMLTFGLFSYSAHADTWIPTPASGIKGYKVNLVVYDMRNAQYPQIQVLLENNTNYFYVFNSQDPLQISKANAIYSTFLTAKSSGEVVSIYTFTANPTLIVAAQLGPNP